jgi:glucosamine kinase
MLEFLVGVDGGGSGTRALLARRDGSVIGNGLAGPSGLSRGIAPAWSAIAAATQRAFESAGLRPAAWSDCALGAGLAGASHLPWRDAFLAVNPGFARIALDSDSFTMLLGAHAGRPGVIVAAGTGSVGEVLRADGSRTSLGGWGFPIGDEGSGAWLGWQAVRHAQAAMDGRAPAGALARQVWTSCGDDRVALLDWCRSAGQFEYAQLAPAVFAAEAEDAQAAALLTSAVVELEALALALDPAGELPLAVSGSVGRRLSPRFSAPLRDRCVALAEGADAGALTLIRRALLLQATSP